ncbi:MAG: T9SS type A sorting domain-containing protein [Flavobacteriales bacterium]|nr:T9SS type A sorting domain-containing protein [Flavobacteriales bacterium]
MRWWFLGLAAHLYMRVAVTAQVNDQGLLTFPGTWSPGVLSAVASPGDCTVMVANDGFQGVALKLASDGTVIWGRTIITNPTSAQMTSIVATQDGGACALLVPTFSTGGTAILVRMDAIGNLLWSKRITSFSLAGPDVLRMEMNETEEYFLIGTKGSITAVVKLDASGEPLWCSRVLIGSSPVEYARDIEPMSDGGCVFSMSDAANSLVIGRLDAQGAVVWINDYAVSQGSLDGWGADVTADIEGNITVVAGFQLNESLSMRIGQDGSIKHATHYQAIGQDYLMYPQARAIEPNRVYLTGKTAWGSFLLCADSIGGLTSAIRSRDDTLGSAFRRMEYWGIDEMDSVSVLVGAFTESNVVNPTYFTVLSVWRSDNYFSSACYVEPIAITASSLPTSSIAINGVGQSLTSTATSQPISVICNASTGPITSSLCSILQVNEMAKEGSLFHYPDPVVDEVIVEGSMVCFGGAWSILDPSGVLVARGSITSEQLRISVEALAPGTYFLRVDCERCIVSGRFIKL